MARKSRTGRGQRGFTVAELLVVLLIVGLLAAIAVPNISGTIERAREAALREDLSVMRRALDSYFADTGAYPASLNDLVEKRYLRDIPADPIAGRDKGWEVEQAREGGISDVRSAADGTGSDGVPYGEW